jgi:peptide/nickel transport system permease protein
VQPSWIGTFQQTSPTGFPTIDALIHHSWYLAWESVKRQILPAITIAYGSVAGILRFVRNSMLEVMNLDFIRTARSKGVAESVVVRKHAGRNSLNVTITVLGLTFAGFIGGFAIIEDVFGLKGIGLLLAYSIQPSIDFGLVFGTTLLFTIIVVAANIIVDILYAYLDPRVRLG